MLIQKKSRRAAAGQIARWAQFIEALSEITVEISQSTDLKRILDHSLRRCLGLIHVDKGGIYLLDERSGLLNIAAQCSTPPFIIEQIKGIGIHEGL